MAKEEKDLQKIARVMNDLLYKSYFIRYYFDTSFSLVFDQSSEELPHTFRLDLLGEWSIHANDEWNQNFPVLSSERLELDLEEPLQACKLAALRWYGDSAVCAVRLNNDVFEIHFKNGWKITLSGEPVEGPSWILHEDTAHEPNWGVTCEGGQYYIIHDLEVS